MHRCPWCGAPCDCDEVDDPRRDWEPYWEPRRECSHDCGADDDDPEDD
jgi:hypothetical protein